MTMPLISRQRPWLPELDQPPSIPDRTILVRQGQCGRRQRLPWAELLRRVFAVDVLVCPRCLGPMTVLAALSDPPVLAKILTHLGLPSTSPALAPAQRRGQLDFFDELSEGDADGATGPWETMDTPHQNMRAGPSRDPPLDALGDGTGIRTSWIAPEHRGAGVQQRLSMDTCCQS